MPQQNFNNGASRAMNIMKTRVLQGIKVCGCKLTFKIKKFEGADLRNLRI